MYSFNKPGFFFKKKKVLEGRHVLSRSLQQLAKQEGCLQRSWNRYKVQLTGNCQLDRIATRLLQCKCIRRHPLLKACEHLPDLSPPSSVSPFSSPAQTQQSFCCCFITGFGLLFSILCQLPLEITNPLCGSKLKYLR